MKERAFAKINLCLDVVRRREDGYHELNMIMVPIDFYDVVEINIADEMSLKTNAGYLPIDEKNTVIKAIQVLREEYGFEENFEIILTKHIPTQAGLAGGSADGAAAMRIVKKLLNLEIDDNKMNELAKKVGADVPFCIHSRPAVVTGIGENLEYFDLESDFIVFLVKPNRGVSTKMAFEQLNFEKCTHPDAQAMKKALIEQDYEAVLNQLGNSLEESAYRLVPQIASIRKELLNFGFDGALMSGSGSTVFGITKNEALADRAVKVFKRKGYFVRKTKIKEVEEKNA